LDAVVLGANSNEEVAGAQAAGQAAVLEPPERSDAELSGPLERQWEREPMVSRLEQEQMRPAQARRAMPPLVEQLAQRVLPPLEAQELARVLALGPR
jgi:hypothetical protein